MEKPRVAYSTRLNLFLRHTRGVILYHPPSAVRLLTLLRREHVDRLFESLHLLFCCCGLFLCGLQLLRQVLKALIEPLVISRPVCEELIELLGGRHRHLRLGGAPCVSVSHRSCCEQRGHHHDPDEPLPRPPLAAGTLRRCAIDNCHLYSPKCWKNLCLGAAQTIRCFSAVAPNARTYRRKNEQVTSIILTAGLIKFMLRTCAVKIAPCV